MTAAQPLPTCPIRETTDEQLVAGLFLDGRCPECAAPVHLVPRELDGRRFREVYHYERDDRG